MSKVIVITGSDLRELLGALDEPTANGREVYKISVDPRGERVAVKVNEGMWTASLGSVTE